MSDASWREGARALRTGAVSPKLFAAALGDNYFRISELLDAMREYATDLKCPVCGHYQFTHWTNGEITMKPGGSQTYCRICFDNDGIDNAKCAWVI